MAKKKYKKLLKFWKSWEGTPIDKSSKEEDKKEDSDSSKDDTTSTGGDIWKDRVTKGKWI